MTSERVSASLRALVAERARDCCEYCRSQARFAMQAFSVEHIEPRSREGETSAENLALSCQGCNNHKYTRTQAADPVGGDLVPLFHPRGQRWQDHFAWNEDCSLIVALTPTGRATVEALQLNRPGLVSLRRLLYAAGEHPPPES
jgi:5-methylcytosine-specific restriction endonuclease McrA